MWWCCSPQTIAPPNPSVPLSPALTSTRTTFHGATKRKPLSPIRAPSRAPIRLSVAPHDEPPRDAPRAGGPSPVARSTTLVELEYADLGLKEKSVGHVRIRQHVNPLSTALSVPAEPPEWGQVFRDPTLPLMVDIGCGSGRFLLWLAKKFPDSKNFLGLEIRRKLVKRAEFWVKELALGNIYFMFANATVSFERLVTTYSGPLVIVSILCPDPYFKSRHHKRRILQQPLVDSISKNLVPGGRVFMQSDVCELAIDMRNRFDSLSDIFGHVDCDVPCDSGGWLLCNPMGIRTEREIHAESEGAKIYRRLYHKKGQPSCRAKMHMAGRMGSSRAAIYLSKNPHIWKNG